ncbi:MAG: hypothetical protein EOO01_26660 [Chitinophagaceae bacterium]|nr:MAG: hypothetical protein EOO01_26660 [Chitinophagaceae bacterium]
MEIRELVDGNSFTRELGHFIAHPERDKGLCYEEINLKAAILNCKPYTEGNIQFPDNSDLYSIEKPVYQILTNRALTNLVNRTRQNFGQKSIPSKEEIEKYIKGSYEFDSKENRYVLKKKENTKKLLEIFNACFHYYGLAPLITGEEIIKDLDNQISRLYRSHIQGTSYNNEITRNQNDLIICIFSLLQAIDFKTYNQSRAKFLVSHEPANKEEAINRESDLEIEFRKLKESLLNERIQLYMLFSLDALPDCPATVNFIPSEIRLGDYITQDDIDSKVNRWLELRIKTQSLDWSITLENDLLKDCYTERNENGKLRLVLNNISG